VPCRCRPRKYACRFPRWASGLVSIPVWGLRATFVICFRLPVSFCVVDGSIVVYPRGEQIWCAFLRFGGLNRQHVDGLLVWTIVCIVNQKINLAGVQQYPNSIVGEYADVQHVKGGLRSTRRRAVACLRGARTISERGAHELTMTTEPQTSIPSWLDIMSSASILPPLLNSGRHHHSLPVAKFTHSRSPLVQLGARGRRGCRFTDRSNAAYHTDF